MIKWLARWVLRAELKDLNAQLQDAKLMASQFSDAAQAARRELQAQKDWWRFVEVMTSPEDVQFVRNLKDEDWQRAIAELQFAPGRDRMAWQTAVAMINEAMRGALRGLLRGAKVRFQWEARPSEPGKVLRASVFVDRAEFHVARAVDRAPYGAGDECVEITRSPS